MSNVVMFSDIVEKNGKTIRENNMERLHSIPVDTLVEVQYDDWLGGGACAKTHARLWVVEHGRDCDGTPLYWLGPNPLDVIKTIVCDTCVEITGEPVPVLGDREEDNADTRRFWHIARMMGIVLRGGFAEDSLMSIQVTEELKKGVGALNWG